MPLFGSIVPASSVPNDARVQRAKRSNDADRARQRGKSERPSDAYELTTVEAVEQTQDSERLPSPESEASREDRESLGYDAQGEMTSPAPPRLDLEV
ncbi:MAG: hypothetical protein AAGD00_04055 [Planctomycetota bacterium]